MMMFVGTWGFESEGLGHVLDTSLHLGVRDGLRYRLPLRKDEDPVL